MHLKNDVPELFDVRLVFVIYASFQSATIAPQQQTKASQVNFLIELLNDPDAEPVKYLSDGNKADSQTESADSPKA